MTVPSWRSRSFVWLAWGNLAKGASLQVNMLEAKSKLSKLVKRRWLAP